ncbi:unnamed protein product [Lactuca saligna]|uniref:RNA helicase n=1 Tax=Lactuca saligna TaxID=75948 RepID=A0AA35YJQ1_LACSI|nr:unnamed protein product [Lactuca saligna]
MKRSIGDIGEKLQAKKPVFLSKSEREQLALKRRQDEFEERKRQSGQLLLQSNRNSSSSKPPPSSDDASRNNRSSRDYDRDCYRRDRDRDTDRERERERERDSERRNRDRQRDEENKARERACLEKLAEREREKELDAIKEQYLGSKKPKKRVIKPSDKFRFSFDWENTEDTSRDMNILYQNSHEARLLFGRGFRAGMDRREQKKLAAKNEKELRDKIRKKDGIEERPEEAAAMYDTFDMRVDRHWSEKKLEEMTERDWRIFREDFNISYKGSRIPRPMRSWVESKLSNELLKAVERAGYKTPSPIQMAAIPLGLQQRDVIGVAETGSENSHSKLRKRLKFANYLGIKVVSIVGGRSIDDQAFKISQGCEVVIATPGRLKDCLKSQYAVLNQCNYVVLDEADRMIDMGMEPQVVEILDAMPSSNFKPENEDEELDEKRIYRTTYMFSATMPPAVERLARKYLRNPVIVTVGTAGKANDLITQHVMMVKESEKMPRLQELLDELVDKKVIVFVNTKITADHVSKKLEKSGYCVTTLRGGKSQEQRETGLEGFRTKRFNVLVATDVAGRGIDIPDVARVINYDMPGKIEMYTHRIGRTGRAGKTDADT